MDITRALDALPATLEHLKLGAVLALSKFASLTPKIGKVAICVLFLVNIRSWPLVWHARVFRFAYLLRLRHKLVMLCATFKSPAEKALIESKWLDSITPIGEHPFNVSVPYKSWASIDDSDFNGHLSNSSYAKSCDSARFKAALYMFPRFFPVGGWMPLAATHFHYIREIPMFASYEVRTSIAAWDHKWVYVMSKFVRKADDKKKKAVPDKAENESVIRTQMVPIRTPADATLSSVNGTPSPTPREANGVPTTEALNAVAAGLVNPVETDGAVVHTVVISQMCFKIGRITIPPALVFAFNGLTNVPGYSRTDPHPEWAKVQETMSKAHGGSLRKARKFLEGGWREVPENERWWDQVLGGEVEARRVKNLERVDHLRRGLEGARGL